MLRTDDDGLTWRTSTYTDAAACVEVAAPPGRILVRDSKRRQGARIPLDPAAWSALVDWARTHQV